MSSLTTRRLAGALTGLVLLSMARLSFAADSPSTPMQNPPELEMTVIHQEVTFKCTLAQLFKALTTASDFATFTGFPAEITAKAGGKFSAFGGQITGMNIELKKAAIVQAWRVASWPPGSYSMVRFSLESSGTGSKLVLDQAGFPQGTGDHLQTGWHSMYWEPLAKFCEAR